MPAKSAGQPQAPPALRHLQDLLTGVIRLPISVNTQDEWQVPTSDFAPAAMEMVTEQLPLDRAERLAVYHRQYWFRLLTVMQEDLPLTCQLLGFRRFNDLMMAHLQRCPPRSPYMRHLSRGLLASLRAGLPVADQPLVMAAARLDLLYDRVFYAPDQAILEPQSLGDAASTILLTTPLRWQAHARLWREAWPLVRQRLRAKRITTDSPAPVLVPRRAYWLIHRQQGWPTTTRLAPLAWRLIRHLQHRPAPLAEALDSFANQLTRREQAKLERHLQAWFGDWVAWGCFVAPGSASMSPLG
jgi:hypothetical protein